MRIKIPLILNKNIFLISSSHIASSSPHLIALRTVNIFFCDFREKKRETTSCDKTDDSKTTQKNGIFVLHYFIREFYSKFKGIKMKFSTDLIVIWNEFRFYSSAYWHIKKRSVISYARESKINHEMHTPHFMTDIALERFFINYFFSSSHFSLHSSRFCFWKKILPVREAKNSKYEITKDHIHLSFCLKNEKNPAFKKLLGWIFINDHVDFTESWDDKARAPGFFWFFFLQASNKMRKDLSFVLEISKHLIFHFDHWVVGTSLNIIFEF